MICPGLHIADRSLFVDTLILWQFRLSVYPTAPSTDAANQHAEPFRVVLDLRSSECTEELDDNSFRATESEMSIMSCPEFLIPQAP